VRGTDAWAFCATARCQT